MDRADILYQQRKAQFKELLEQARFEVEKLPTDDMLADYIDIETRSIRLQQKWACNPLADPGISDKMSAWAIAIHEELRERDPTMELLKQAQEQIDALTDIAAKFNSPYRVG